MPAWHHLLIFFAFVYGAAYGAIELSQVAGRVAAIWPANAIVLAVLLQSSRRRWPMWVGSGFLANFAADLTAGDAPLFGFALSVFNVVEIVVAAVSIHVALGVKQLSFTNGKALLQFFLLAGGLAPAVSATMAAAYLLHVKALPFATTWLTWFAGDALGMAIIAPVLISVDRQKLLDLLRQRRLVEAITGSVFICVVVAIAFSHSDYPLTYLCVPLLILGAFRFGFVGAAWGLLLTAIVSVALTAQGAVPFATLGFPAAPEEILILQMFLLVMTFTALPVGVVLEKRAVAKRALRLSTERLSQAIRVSDIGIFDHDQVTDTIYWSPRQREIYGWTQDEPVTLLKYIECVHPDDRSYIAAAVQRAHDPKVNIPFDIEHRIIRRDGVIRWLSTRAQTFFEGEGTTRRAVRTVGAVIDITDQKKSSEKLEFANDLLRTQIENSPDGILVVDANRKAVLFNRRFGELWKIPQEIVAARVDDAILQTGTEQIKDPEAFYARVMHLYDHPEETANEDIEFKDGRTFERHTAPLRGANDKYLGRVWVFHDITERKRSEEQIRQLQKTEAMGKLTGGVAHDFNNLLAIVGGNLELLEEKLAESPDLRALAQKSLRAVERGATLTRSLLAFSRQQPLSPRVVDLSKLVQEMADLIRRTVPETIEIKVVAGEDLWKSEADPGQLQNALLNLIVNACDAMPEGGRLTIETANVALDDDYAASQAEVSPGQYVMLGVSDTGHGMPPDVLARAFDPFFTTKGPGKGSGLGLSMVYGFAKQSSGYARIYSEIGQGSTVRIYLPRSQAPAEEFVAEVPTGDLSSKGETILVVEDDPDVRSLTCELLQSLGYDILEAGDPQAALQHVRDTPRIALLLLDVVLPGGMNGPELAAAALRLRPELNVLYMSGYTENAVLHHGRLDPDVHLLQKPFTRRALASSVRRLLDSSFRRQR